MLKKIKFIIFLFYFFSYLELHAKNKIIIQSSTSVKNSGLYNYIIPIFKEKKNIDVYIVAVGTGAALNNAKNCDGDLVIVHAKEKEINFINSGYGLKRYNLMYNNFIIVGPIDDPANISNSISPQNALKKIAKSKHNFISRGDNSGTHIKEMKLWKEAEIDPLKFSGQWYKETGSGQSTTLSMSQALNAYVLTDKASFISLKNKNNLKILFSKSKNLKNQYGILEINKKHCPNLNHEGANTFLRWILSDEGQKSISSFKIDGEQLFFTE